MRYVVLACDYDGTLASDGVVAPSTVAALEALRASGRRLILVTGRELADLQGDFDRVDLFDRVVAENGALLYGPAEDRQVPLAPPPSDAFVQALRSRGVEPLGVGSTIVSTRRPNELLVLEAISELGLDLQITFNKGAVMVLPSTVSKCTGLLAALHDLRLSPHNTVGIGDAENDHAFLRAAEAAVAVANALPSLKEQADWTTSGARGAGVEELIDSLLRDDLRMLEPPPRLARDRREPAAPAREFAPVSHQPARGGFCQIRQVVPHAWHSGAPHGSRLPVLPDRSGGRLRSHDWGGEPG